MNIRHTFENLCFSGLQKYVESGQEENLLLDFKLVNNAQLTSSDDKNLAKALSGFSNSSGGLIVWGIDARKNTKGIDCATDLKPIINVKFFLSRLNELTGMAVSPLVDGIDHRLIPSENDSGFVVTFVPESISGPHMAKMGEDRYYKRSGDSFYRLEHFDLEDMFGRRPRPKLECATRIIGSDLESRIIIGIKNEGRGSAKAPFIAFNCNAPFQVSSYGLDGNMNEGMKRLPHIGTDLPHRYGEGSNVVIHPGITHEVAAVILSNKSNKPQNDLIIEYALACEGFNLKKGIIVIQLQSLGIS